MLVGEIGIPRKEFLYEIRFWEARRIVRGYRKRNRPIHQLLAQVIYTAKYANPYRQNDGKTAVDMYPQYFEDDDDEDMESESPITEEERQELVSIMNEMNSKKAGIK